MFDSWMQNHYFFFSLTLKLTTNVIGAMTEPELAGGSLQSVLRQLMRVFVDFVSEMPIFSFAVH